MKPSPDQPSLFEIGPPGAENPEPPLPPVGAPATAPSVGKMNPSPAAGPIEPGNGALAPELEPAEDDAIEASELADWKDALRRDFEHWLDALEEIPEPVESLEPENEDPDLYSLHEQLVAANAESRKANRRTAEAISQWGQTLTRFEESLAPLRETTAQLAAAQPKAGQMSRAHCLALVEVLDRMHRLARAFLTAPAARNSWWSGGGVNAWRQAWETQRQGLDILVGHVEALLGKEGVTRIETLGQSFDPTLMMAVATEPDAARPPQTVVEELAAGYRLRGELLRAAQVKVTRQPGPC